MSKFRELLAQRRNEVATQWHLFCAVFDSDVVTPDMQPEQIDTLRTVMWASWRACAYTNGVITEPRPTGSGQDT